ncbi:MAG: M20/M25/M40 family metallo-hydrolase [Acidobacteriota bacterium]|nr:M20/M25/M40 family metallo-hydrolase [Acidobacteriota bacterium]
MFDEHWEQSGHIEAAIQLLADWARQRALAGAEVAIHRLAGRTPVLTVTVPATGPAEGTCVLYGHLDKQPPLGDWSEGLDPYVPVRRGDRLYGRGMADDGYSIFAALLALESLEAEGRPHARCVVLIEASEESASSDLEAHLDALAEHLGRVELMVCLDSGALTYDRLWVTTSLRGNVNVRVTVDVVPVALHSGIASGVVPSSFRVLRQLLDRVEDARNGKVLLPELYADVPEQHERGAAELIEEFGDVAAEGLAVLPGVRLMGKSAVKRQLRRTWRPALSVIGMGGIPDPAVAGNVLRTSTTAVLSMRLPPTVSSTAAAQRLVDVLSADPPEGAHVTVTVDSLGDGWASTERAAWLTEALGVASREAFGRDPGFVGEGGSIPFLAELGRRYPECQFVATGVVGPGANAHGIDEMLHLPTALGVTNAVATIVEAHARAPH